ncbi:hypothetical protein Mapa_015744 [Marchantia paleacea]|nr:hypothetical protein Mapa_015744 [Marchantia paleacea]
MYDSCSSNVLLQESYRRSSIVPRKHEEHEPCQNGMMQYRYLVNIAEEVLCSCTGNEKVGADEWGFDLCVAS